MNTIGIEVGNSRLKLGVFQDSKLVEVRVIQTQDVESLSLPAGWEKIKPVRIGVASVVPSVNPVIKKKFSSFYRKHPLIIRPSGCGIPLKIKNPETVGVDRVLNCKAAMRLFGSPVIVVDIGTAITIDAAAKTAGFTGGCIIPNGKLWMDALTTTSMIKGGRIISARFPGKNTDEAISAGIRYGIPGAINSILTHAFKKYPSAMLVLTGGGINRNILRDISFKGITRKYLTMEGVGFVIG
jgi:type III pantothenate kinase